MKNILISGGWFSMILRMRANIALDEIDPMCFNLHLWRKSNSVFDEVIQVYCMLTTKIDY